MHKVSDAVAKRRLHSIRRAGIDQLDFTDIDTSAMEAVFQHREWLLCMVGNKLSAFQIFPMERRASGSACDEESVALVDLGKVNRDIPDPF
jgi:hypothetical protein